MICIECDGKTMVFDTVTETEYVYRKRKCVKCGKIFMTSEAPTITNVYAAKAAFSNKWKRGNKKND